MPPTPGVYPETTKGLIWHHLAEHLHLQPWRKQSRRHWWTQPSQNSTPIAQQEGDTLEQPMPGTKIPCAVLKVKKLSFDQSGTTVTTATLRYSKNKKKKPSPNTKKPEQTSWLPSLGLYANLFKASPFYKGHTALEHHWPSARAVTSHRGQWNTRSAALQHVNWNSRLCPKSYPELPAIGAIYRA